MYTWHIDPTMRAFVFHLAGNVEHCSVASLLYRAVTHYSLREHKISYHEFAKDLRLETPDELRLQVLLKDQRTKSLTQENAELRYQLRELKREREQLINAGFTKS